MMSSTETSRAPHQFKQELKLFDATMIVIGSMIGSGIFIVSADIARTVGSPAYLFLVWLLAGVITLIAALSYGELAGMMPQAGGQYVYLREAYNPLVSFLFGWTVFLVIQTGSIAAIAVAFAKFTGEVIPWFSENNKLLTVTVGGFTWKLSASQPLAIAVVVLLTWINIRGVRQGKIVQNVFTVAKTVALIGLIILGITVGKNAAAISANFSNFWSGNATDISTGTTVSLEMLSTVMVLSAIGVAMVGSLFASDGWNNVTFIAGEVVRPQRNIPLSLTLGTAAVTLLYMMVTLSYAVTLPVSGDLKGDPWFETAVANVAQKGKVSAELRQSFQENGHSLADGASIAGKARVKENGQHRDIAWSVRDLDREYFVERDPQNEDRLRVYHPASTEKRGMQQALNDRVGTASSYMIFKEPAVIIMALLIMVSTFGCCNASLLSGARVYYSMAQDGLFFKKVGVLNSRGVPAVGLVVQAVWASLLCLSGKYGDLLDYVIFSQLFFYILTVAGVFILRKKQPNAARPYKTLCYPLLPALYILLGSAICVDLLIFKPNYTWPGLIIVLLGIPVYFVWKKNDRAVNVSEGR